MRFMGLVLIWCSAILDKLNIGSTELLVPYPRTRLCRQQQRASLATKLVHVSALSAQLCVRLCLRVRAGMVVSACVLIRVLLGVR